MQNYLSQEQKLINDVRSKIGNRFLGDDCAILPGGLVVTSDTLVEGTHFILKREKASLEDLGWKSLAVSLSDIAAMAGCPRFALLAITMPDQLSRRHFGYLYDGLLKCSKRYKTAIVGGDITKGAVLTITVTVIGEANKRGCLLRSGARPGDIVVVTGSFGASKAGLKLLLQSPKMQKFANDNLRDNTEEPASYACLESHRRPFPRLKEAWALVNETGSRGALMDASDGLADALSQIARSSDVGMLIDLNQVPIKAETIAIAKLYGEKPLDWALYGGEDYELVGCLPETTWQAWRRKMNIGAIPFQPIGKVTNSGRVDLMVGQEKGPALDLSRCFQHIA